MMSFLNANAGAITALFTAGIAIFTLIYVGGTLLMWLEMRATRKRMDKPNIQLSLEPQVRWGNLFDLIVENLGNVPVYDLKLEIKPSGLKTIGERKLDELNLFKIPIPVFGMGQKIKTLAIDYVGFIHGDQPKQISLIAKYKTDNKKYLTQQYDFDLQIYEGMSASSESSLKDVVEAVNKLTDEVKIISRK
jgi:hypothetical protein